MKTKNVLRILAVVFAMVTMLAIASCDLLLPEETTTAHVHSETVLAAVEATCTETGLTEGKKCTTCGQVTVPQQVVPAKGHTEEVVAAVEATCTSIGLTEGKKCSVCDVTLKAQDIIPAKGHTPEDVKAIAATCTQQGLTAGKKCSVCDAILEAQTLVPALGHTAGAAATCTAAQTCTVCKAELAPATGHTWGTEVTTVTAATCAVDGKGTVKCKNCEATKEQVIPATGEHTWDAGVITVAPSCADGVKLHTCSVCKGTKEEAIPGNGQHAYGEEVVVAPATCCSTGYKSKTCAVCGTVKKVDLAALTKGTAHHYTNGKCDVVVYENEETGEKKLCGACETHSYRKYTKNDFTDPRYNLTWGFCEDCGYVDPKHEHIIKNGVCYYCEYVYDEVPQPSIVDNDGDGENDYFYFAQALPERFREDMIYINAKRDQLSTNFGYYDEIDAGSANQLPYPHHYAHESDRTKYLLYNVTVEESGIYEVAVYLRVKNEEGRGALYTINEGTPGEYTFETFYIWPTADDRAEVQNNDFLIGVYMFVEMELHEGVNTIKITTPEKFLKSQHIRALFFNLKEEKHVHNYAIDVQESCVAEGVKTYTCTCGDIVKETLPINPQAHALNDEHVCTLCNKNFSLTTDEASDLGLTLDAGAKLPDKYWVTVTFNNGAPRYNDTQKDGFCRVVDSKGNQMSVYNIILAEGQEMPKAGDTVVLECVLGCVTSKINGDLGKEARIFDAKIVKVVAECDHAAGFNAATCVSPETCKTCGRTRGEKNPEAHSWKDATCKDPKTCALCGKTEGEKNENHVWKDATCVDPKTCTVCGATEGEAAGGHNLDENYKCTVCEKNFLLTLEEAWELGTKCETGADKCDSETYYIQITLDAQANPNGFARATLVVGEKYISINGGYLTGDAEGSIKLGDTVILKGNLGASGYAVAKSGKEARLFNATVVKNLSTGCEHTYGEEVVLVPVAPTCCELGKGVVKCTKCAGAKTVDIKALGHDLVEGVCSRCGTSELNDDDKAWLTAQGLDADKYLKLDLKFNMNQYYNPTNNGTGGKWVNDGGSHEMATRIITKAEMGAGSVVRIDHIAKDENGKWATMIQYRPEFFISSTGKCVATARQSGVKVGGMLEVTDEWWKGITDGRKSDKFDRISFSLTVLDVTAVADEDSKYTTTPDKTYALSEADYDNFVIYVLKPAQ